LTAGALAATDWIRTLAGRQRDGYALDQPFYASEEVFARDFATIVSRQWLFADHESRIPNPGDWFLFNVGEAQLIIIRDDGGAISALHNSCRHRGSLICLEAQGTNRRLVCPYHGWTYDTRGRLLGSRRMPDGFEREHHGLKSCLVEVLEGLVFVRLDTDAPSGFSTIRTALTPFLRPHRLDRARVVARELYSINGNWKLVRENFLECYHCHGAHSEYCAINDLVKLFGDGSEQARQSYAELCAAWTERAAALGHVTGSVRSEPQDSAADAIYFAQRHPIREGFDSMTRDGKAAAPLMGDFKVGDSGTTTASVSYFGGISAPNDFAALSRITPRAAQRTDVEFIWVADAAALEPGGSDPERLKWLWHVTTLQDRQLIENNQRGVCSPAYRPGPYSTLEGDTADFTRWYLAQLAG
jgi:phenylpropionate dioxygenase-like ring-hydroxylating dioxygenase large terminal subunit